MITPEQIADWKALADNATPAPWDVFGEEVMQGAATIADMHSTRETMADGHFIAAAREAMPALIAEVETLRAVLQKAEWTFTSPLGSKCPSCDAYRSFDKGHEPDCALAAALR